MQFFGNHEFGFVDDDDDEDSFSDEEDEEEEEEDDDSVAEEFDGPIAFTVGGRDGQSRADRGA